MYNKISSMLDRIASSLESKGYFKEALELDKIADELDNSSKDCMRGFFVLASNQAKKAEVVPFKALTVFAVYLINGDTDSLTSQEIRKADSFIKGIESEYGRGHVSMSDDEPNEFGRCEITGLRGNVADFEYVVMKK